MKFKNEATIVLTPVDKSEHCRYFMSLKDCAPGWDDIQAQLFKLGINLSIGQGVFPDLGKLAVIVPLFKSGDSKIVVNYRPISLLSTASKIFEGVYYKRLIYFVNNHNL